MISMHISGILTRASKPGDRAISSGLSIALLPPHLLLRDPRLTAECGMHSEAQTIVPETALCCEASVTSVGFLSHMKRNVPLQIKNCLHQIVSSGRMWPPQPRRLWAPLLCPVQRTARKQANSLSYLSRILEKGPTWPSCLKQAGMQAGRSLPFLLACVCSLHAVACMQWPQTDWTAPSSNKLSRISRLLQALYLGLALDASPASWLARALRIWAQTCIAFSSRLSA